MIPLIWGIQNSQTHRSREYNTRCLGFGEWEKWDIVLNNVKFQLCYVSKF